MRDNINQAGTLPFCPEIMVPGSTLTDAKPSAEDTKKGADIFPAISVKLVISVAPGGIEGSPGSGLVVVGSTGMDGPVVVGGVEVGKVEVWGGAEVVGGVVEVVGTTGGVVVGWTGGVVVGCGGAGSVTL